MSLQGSLETIALRDVLTLLATSSKTGELRVTGRVNGQLWLQDGKFVASRVDRNAGHAGHVEAVFQLLRLARGDFVFEDGAAPAEPGEPTAVDVVLHSAEDRLAEWRVIEAAIPSVESVARLRPELPEDHVTLRGDQWRMIVAIGGGVSVRQAIEALGLAEFEGCRGLKELIDAGLMTIEVPPSRVTAVATEPQRMIRRRPLPQSELNGRAVPVEAAPAAAEVIADPNPVVVPTGPVPVPALAEALAAVAAVSPPAEVAPPSEVSPTRAFEAGRARRARRVTATRDEALATHAPDPPPAPPVPPIGVAASPSSLGSVLRAARQGGPRAIDSAAQVAPVAHGAATSPPEPVAPDPADDTADHEPINRGLLLKFLSSVRS